MLAPWKKSCDQPRQHIKKQGHYLAVCLVKAIVFPVVLYGCEWGLDHKESWVPKNWCFWNMVLEKTLESPLDSEEMNPVNSKGNQSWIFIGRTDAKAEIQYFGHLMRRTDSLEKSLEKIECRRRRGHRRWDGWMASPTRWTWVWVSSGSWWWTGKPGVLQSMGSQRVGHDWATDLTDIYLAAPGLSCCMWDPVPPPGIEPCLGPCIGSMES